MRFHGYAVAFSVSLALLASDGTIEQWAPARWGMTEQEVLGAFKGVARVLSGEQASRQFKDRIAPIGIDDVAVGGVELRALFLFDKSGRLDRIHLSPLGSAPPTDDQFRKIEDSLAHKYGEPIRAEGGTKSVSAWILPRSVVELDYLRPVYINLRFDSQRGQTAESLTEGLAVVSGHHVFAERFSLPSWLTPFPHDQGNQTVVVGDHLHTSYDASAPFLGVVGHYETVLHNAAGAGVTYRESGDGIGGTIFRASQNRTSCSVQVRKSANGAHVEVDCGLSPDTVATNAATGGMSTAPARPHSPSGQSDFRGTRWGMSKSDVVAAETVKLVPTKGDTLAGQDTIDGRRVFMFYEFVDGKLGRANYSLAESYTEPNMYIGAANQLVAALSEKYGQPKREAEWLNKLYSNDPLKYGFAISAGHLIIRNYWETDRTKLVQFTVGENFKVTVAVRYTSKEFEAALAQKEKDAQQKLF
jgi:hypothetical protein